MNFSHLQILRKANGVKRWHTCPTQRYQNLAEHSAGVAWLMSIVHPNPTYQLVMAALTHDLAEYSTGDVPAHVKWGNDALTSELEILEKKWLDSQGIPFLNDLSDFDKLVLDFCDRFELMLWSIEELQLGNTNMIVVLENISRYLSMLDKTSKASELFDAANSLALKLIDHHVCK